ncbi:probable magnesium transporter NIPA7 isoform X1 [Zingiber officinale]|uniref:probable magnesium transporter NIPA7 isoform X1 n=1 Tax=Zingiber officinale TaxID=94328 RepID=UPI001C4AE05E|nr:probable magnesium transporter NIPA7 isoform X1 [Zingiber officinale]
MGVSDNTKGFVLALVSSAFIGSSFILKKKGLKRAGKSGALAGVGGYAYLLEPLWWAGMITMVLGEAANFVAYVFAPAALVTPLGALSIIVSAVLAHFMLQERLQAMGILGCVSCIVGSVVIVIHAPQEQSPSSVEEIWRHLLTTMHWTLSIQQLSRQFTMLCLLLTIVASAIMFKDWSGQNISSIASEICGFITVISGTILLHSTKEQDVFPSTGSMSWVIGRGSGDPMKTSMMTILSSCKVLIDYTRVKCVQEAYHSTILLHRGMPEYCQMDAFIMYFYIQFSCLKYICFS